MDEFIKYLDSRISKYQNEDTGTSFLVFAELMKIKLFINKVLDKEETNESKSR